MSRAERLEESEERAKIEKELKEKLLEAYSEHFGFLKETIKNNNDLDPTDLADEIIKVIRKFAFIYNLPWTNEIYIRYKGKRLNWTSNLKKDIKYILKILNVKKTKHRMDEIKDLIYTMTEIPRERINMLRRYAVTKNSFVLDRIEGKFLSINLSNIRKFVELFEDELGDNEEIIRNLSILQKIIEFSSLSPEELKNKIKSYEDMIEWNKKQKYPVNDKIDELKALKTIQNLNLPGPLTEDSDLSYIPGVKELWNHIISLLPFPHCLNVNYNPEAKAPRWEQFLNEVMDKKYHTAIKRFMGYSLYYDIFTHIPNIAMLIGDGSNGKGVFLTAISDVLGRENISAVSVQDINKRFENLGLLSAILNLAGDIPPQSLIDTGTIKAMTGRDPIPFESKYKDRFEEVVYVKHIFSANQMPKTRDKSYGFYRRWMIFMFPRIFEKKDADPLLRDKLYAERDGIFNWMLEGLKEFLQTLDLNYPLSVKEVRDIYETASNSLLRFLQEECEKAPGEIITVDDFYRLYVAFCKERNLSELSKIEVSKQITALSPYVDRVGPMKIKGVTRRGYKNIRVKYKPPEERKEYIEEMQKGKERIEEWQNQVEVEFIQDYSWGKINHKKGEIVDLDDEKAQDLQNRGIVKIRMNGNEEIPPYHAQVLVLEDFEEIWQESYNDSFEKIHGKAGTKMILPNELASMLRNQGKVKVLRRNTNG